MDTKSLAKSKRAHSQHHSKKHHPKPTSKAPSAGVVGATGSQKPNVKQFKEKFHHSQGSKQLPSNWDRYEDEFDLDSKVPLQGSTSQLTDVIVPKSKGSDYAHLISEAKSHAQSNYPTGSFPSFDDVFTDFNQEVGSLLYVRGQNILSWAAEEDFLLEDKASGGQEASFLSMDLNALAEQLAKVELSQRLFIEADLLPPELCTEGLPTSHEHESCKSEVSYRNETINEVSSELSDRASLNGWETEVTGTTNVDHPVKNELSVSTSRSDESFMPESKSQICTKSASIQNKSHSRFKPAEAELDILLDSFCEPNILQSALLKEEPGYSFNVGQGVSSTTLSVGTSSDQLVSTPMKNSLDLSKSTSTLDDSLDDLLKETSNQINQDILLQFQDVKTASPNVLPSPSSGPTKSKLLDDFDSWLDTI